MPFFEHHAHLRAVIESVLEGRLGSASVDNPEYPKTVRLVLGVYTFLAGDASTDAAREFISTQEAPCEFIVAGDGDWVALVDEIHGDRITRRTMEAFTPDELDQAHLHRLAATAPEGVTVGQITLDDARELGPELEPNRVSIFGSPEEFLQHGLGICAREGETIVAASTSYTVSSTRVEVAIATHPDHRRRGLAACVGASMLLHCMESGLEAHWTAGNPVSSKVARKLGLSLSGDVPVLYLSR